MSVRLQRGDVVLAAFPFTDFSAKKRRPAIVLNDNTDQGDVILAFIGSHVPSQLGKASVAIEDGNVDFPTTGLKVSSVIRLDKIATIERGLITRRVGHLSPTLLKAVDKALVIALRIPIDVISKVQSQHSDEAAPTDD